MSHVDVRQPEKPPTLTHINATVEPSAGTNNRVRDPYDVRCYLPPPSQKPFRVRKRIAVLGARAVGKSAVAIQCTDNRFEPEYMPTCEDAFLWTTTVDGTKYEVTIVDTDGQDEFPDFGEQYTIGVDGYILMFSLVDESSFHIIRRVHEKLLQTLVVLDPKGTAELPRILVGNQLDMAHTRRVSRQVAQEFADEHGIPYYETSAYTGENVNEVFATLLRIINTNLVNSHKPSENELRPSCEQRESTTTANAPNYCSIQ
ncbi:GTP-binding protein Rheb-like [Gracilariopsis chorda]|uniref:GTP-binding protein Rheb-like n=1 Tax=Gracilariopsis chorda TaxID=448386 RepID=A0A2V3IJT9_9FLOR|nr:GTP-binding protein Rheb-like [Gracilariopsis chorda]|eukprot:PXF42319.1 GTP-binding protein Rheb-like [Gracilariopsis chorda]